VGRTAPAVRGRVRQPGRPQSGRTHGTVSPRNPFCLSPPSRDILGDPMTTWNDLQPALRQMFGKEDYEAWISPLHVTEESSSRLVLSTDNRIVLQWVEDHLLRDLLAVARSQNGHQFEIILQEASTPSPPATSTSENFTPIETPPLLPDFSFERFVIGPSNQFAAAAAHAVAASPGNTYNPLFIYGDSGLGKTHLLHAIGLAALDCDPSLRVTYMTTEHFLNELIWCIQNRKMQLFRQTFREVDLLLLDDVQFIGGKERTQEEFFHTFNSLHSRGRQVVFTSDRKPAEIGGLEERLRTRFLQGLLADVQPPDLETRCAILREKGRALGWDIPEEVLLFISRKIKKNVRELEGSLNRTLAYAQLRNLPLSVDLVRKALFELIPDAHEIKPADIIRFVAQHYGVRVADLKGRTGRAAVSLPRHVSMYLIRHILNLSYPDIAKIFSKHHSSIIYAVESIEKKRNSNPDFDSTLTSFIEHFSEL